MAETNCSSNNCSMPQKFSFSSMLAQKSSDPKLTFLSAGLSQDLHGEGIIVSPRMMADHMPDYVTSVLGRLARDRRRANPDFMESHGPAVGTGTDHTSGPSRSHMAIDIDSESDSDEAAEDEPELKRDR